MCDSVTTIKLKQDKKITPFVLLLAKLKQYHKCHSFVGMVLPIHWLKLI